MSILDAGGQDGSGGGLFLILVSATAITFAWLAIALLAIFG